MKYRKKPVIINAIQYREENIAAMLKFMGVSSFERHFLEDGIIIKTLEGKMTAQIGDWIIKGVKGEFYPCKPDIFEMTYEAVDE